MKALTQALLAVATAGLTILSAHAADTRADFDGDGRSDILWRDAATGQNYVYFMNGLSIASEGYLRTVADPAWEVVGLGDFNGDGTTDILWRNAASGQNYLWPMSGTTILATEGYIRTVTDANWLVKGIGDFDGDGKADILWRNAATGENYVYFMSGTSIVGEGYLPTVPSQSWRVAGIGDFNGDGESDILWRNGETGENYVYFMSGTSIVDEGYLPTVPSQSWRVAGIGDFNADGRSDILWRNGETGENYVYLMNGTSIVGQGYVRTVSNLDWTVVGLGDYDGDGKSDILWRNASTGENYLYPMDGTTIRPTEGYIRTVAPTWRLAPAATTAHAADTRADFDGDGRSDILWRNAATGQNYVYFMNGLSIPSEGYLRTVADPAWEVVGLGDFNGDGKTDILWRNAASGENYLYPMSGTTILATEGYIRTVSDANWLVKGIGDFNGDGKADILWRNAATGENYVYLMNGTTILGQGYIRTVSNLDWTVAGLGDYDGDGKSDILWRNGETGENYVYFMSGTSIVGEGYLPTVPSQSWRVAGIGDFNADGRSDILWRNGETGENYIYLMNGTSIVGQGWVRTVSNLDWTVVGLGDYDGDGKSDILWRNASTGENYLYPMDGTTIKPTEGYIRTVALTWRLAPAATTATLHWDAVVAANLSGYRVYYGTDPGTYLQSRGQGLSVGNITTYTLTGLSSGTRYYFAVTAFDSSNNESPYSNEVFKDMLVLDPPSALTYNGKLRDRVGQGDTALAPDGTLDGTLTATLSASGGRTITALRLDSNAPGDWETTANPYWILGAATSLDGALLNNPGNMAVNFPVANGGSFVVFAADYQNTEFLAGPDRDPRRHLLGRFVGDRRDDGEPALAAPSP